MVHHTTHITAQHPGHRLSEDKLVEFDLCQCLLCGTVLSGTSATRTSHRRRQSQRTRLNGIGPTNPTPQPLSLDFLEAPSKEDRAWLSTRPRTLRILHRTEFRTWIQKIRAVPTGYAAKNEKRRHEAQIRVLDLPRLYLQPKSKEGDEGADNEKNDTTGEGAPPPPLQPQVDYGPTHDDSDAATGEDDDYWDREFSVSSVGPQHTTEEQKGKAHKRTIARVMRFLHVEGRQGGRTEAGGDAPSPTCRGPPSRTPP
eukprot:gene6915-biopygen4208